ncbi:DUF2171 domain-containing protein [Rhizobium leguminosarum]
MVDHSKIKQHDEVIGADGHVGTVDRVDDIAITFKEEDDGKAD